MSDFWALGALTISFVYLIVCKSVRSDQEVFTNTWAIHTDNEESAKRIARKHNFVYKGKIGGLEGYYFLEHKAVPKRRRRSTDYHTRRLSFDSNIQWIQQQRVLKRSKRGFIKDPLFKEQWYLENTGKYKLDEPC